MAAALLTSRGLLERVGYGGGIVLSVAAYGRWCSRKESYGYEQGEKKAKAPPPALSSAEATCAALAGGNAILSTLASLASGSRAFHLPVPRVAGTRCRRRSGPSHPIMLSMTGRRCTSAARLRERQPPEGSTSSRGMIGNKPKVHAPCSSTQPPPTLVVSDSMLHAGLFAPSDHLRHTQ